MSEPLFRPEVLEAKRQSWLGGISLAQPLRLWVLAGFAMAAAVAIVLFLALGEYTQRSRVAGQLVPDLGLATVVAPTNGVVERLYLQEGDKVQAGNALALVAVPRSTATGDDAQGSILEGIGKRRESLQAADRSQEDMAAAQAAGYRQQLAAARREFVQTNAQGVTRGEQVALARETLERYRTLGRQKYVSEVQVRQQEQALLDQISSQQDLQRQATTMRRQIAQIEQSLHELGPQRGAQQAATARDLALLEQDRVQSQASGELLVKAPVGGLLASRLIEPGQAVQVGQPLMSVLPTGSRLQAQLFVPSRAVGFIQPGDKVLLRYQAYPYQKFGHQDGVVARISRSALSAGEMNALAGNEQAGEPYYRVLVDISQQSIIAYGKPEALRPGMLVDADILGEHRKLYEWVLEPLYSLTGRL